METPDQKDRQRNDVTSATHYSDSSSSQKAPDGKANKIAERQTATQQLIDIQDEVAEIDRRLEEKKKDFRIRMHLLRKRQEEVDKKELHMKTSLLEMDKFFKENETRKTRANKKTLESHEMSKVKEKELERLEAEKSVLDERKQELLRRLNKYRIYHTFMSKVLDASGADFAEIRAIISRYDTLTVINQDLLEKQLQREETIKHLKKDIVEFAEEKNKEVIKCTMQLAELQSRLDKARARTVQLETEHTKLTHEASYRSMTLGRIIIATNNMYDSVTMYNARTRNQPPEIVSDTMKQLGAIQHCMSDLKYLTIDSGASTHQSTTSKKRHVTISDVETTASTTMHARPLSPSS